MNKGNKILIILTGGTICSAIMSDGKRASDTETAQYKIISNFKESGSMFCETEFDFRSPLDILSENMTINTWNVLLDEFRNTENLKAYKGVILLHGTDTLGFTSSLLSVMLTKLEIPVILVSSQLPLDNEGTNGNANFKAAVELIMNGIAPNVYAVYRNSDGKTYLHYGAHLLQCADYSDDFFSSDMRLIENTDNADLKGVPFKSSENLLRKMPKLESGVLCIKPFVGLDYRFYDLEKVTAVVHGTYHSQSVCVERSRKQGDVSDFSIIKFAKRCKEAEVDLFLAPCNEKAYFYESTADALAHGAMGIANQTFEMAYAKTVIGVSMGLKGEDLCEFVNKNINNEKI